MALRLKNKSWASAEGWLRNQASYDLRQARRAAKTKALLAKRAVEKKAAAEPAAPAKKRA